MKQVKEWMEERIACLNAANEAYYGTGKELMSNLEWDRLYAELEEMERISGIVLTNSPTQKVGYEPVSKLTKENHEEPALSLDKTKDINGLCDFLGDQEALLSWKLDGLTIVLTYRKGKLEKAVTRGNGITGEVITNNAKNFLNLPLKVAANTDFVIRGEAIITYADFDQINNTLPEGEEPYKNPRNLCSGSVRQLDPKETKRRKVRFKAFALVSSTPQFWTRKQQFDYLESLGFDVVEHVLVKNAQELREQVISFEERITENAFPSDGLVLQYNDIAYGKSLGTTAKYPKDAMAFKWQDEIKETTLRKLEWSASRTGRINPIAVFDPVELEGTTVSRASVHNVSIVKALHLNPGDTITVYKANMIIPQVAENKTGTKEPVIPTVCPICGKPAVVKVSDGDAETLWCENPECGAKQVRLFTHAVSRDALNIEGLSEETIRKFMNEGILSELSDLFRLNEKRDEIVRMEGFGEKSYEKLIASAEKARTITLDRLLYALGIENVGRTASKLICNHYGYDLCRVVNVKQSDLEQIPEIGPVIARSFITWFQDQRNQELFENLASEVILERPLQTSFTPFAGYTFVITGSLNHFKNRNELKAKIESLGGKVSGSVSSKTTYLINNDYTSTSGKNKTAKAIGIPIITEETFLSFCEGTI